jgi:poly(3-hydroxybutyrate) depolymerase
MRRRDWLKAMLTTLGASEAGAAAMAPGQARIEDIEISGSAGATRRVRLVLPEGVSADRLLILLHGRGEANSERLALRAWSHLYGLLDAEQRLRHPPVSALLDRPRIGAERLRRVNGELDQRPYRGMVIACPITPNPADHAARAAMFDAYSEWLHEHLVPTLTKRLGTSKLRVGLDGCSMGGYVALEMLMRAPTRYHSFGTVQAAIGAWRAPGYAAGLTRALSAKTAPKIHLQTSTHDPFLAASEALSRALTGAGYANELDVIPGGHDQLWLRQIGTLEMLHWHDRNL